MSRDASGRAAAEARRVRVQGGRESEKGGRSTLLYGQVSTVFSAEQCGPKSEILAQARLDAKNGKVAQGRNIFGFRPDLNKAEMKMAIEVIIRNRS